MALPIYLYYSDAHVCPWALGGYTRVLFSDHAELMDVEEEEAPVVVASGKQEASLESVEGSVALPVAATPRQDQQTPMVKRTPSSSRGSQRSRRQSTSKVWWRERGPRDLNLVEIGKEELDTCGGCHSGGTGRGEGGSSGGQLRDPCRPLGLGCCR